MPYLLLGYAQVARVGGVAATAKARAQNRRIPCAVVLRLHYEHGEANASCRDFLPTLSAMLSEATTTACEPRRRPQPAAISKPEA